VLRVLKDTHACGLSEAQQQKYVHTNLLTNTSKVSILDTLFETMVNGWLFLIFGSANYI